MVTPVTPSRRPNSALDGYTTPRGGSPFGASARIEATLSMSHFSQSFLFSTAAHAPHGMRLIIDSLPRGGYLPTLWLVDPGRTRGAAIFFAKGLALGDEPNKAKLASA